MRSKLRLSFLVAGTLGIAFAAGCGSSDDERIADLERQLGDRQLLVRVDRVELSKNLLRGVRAYDTLLTERPERRWHWPQIDAT